jgi:dihydrodipicolinate synthase/N-acetylneuraminate lyase
MSAIQVLAANLTPFRDGRLDLGCLERHCRWMAEQGVSGFAPTGTTGEFLYLSTAEKRAVHQTVQMAAEGRPVLPCVFDPDAAAMADLARHAVDLGAVGVFLPPPLYMSVDDDAVLAWYDVVRQAVAGPVLAYHHPRVGNPITPALYDRLRAAGIDGMKDSSEDPARVRLLAEAHPGTVWVGGDSMLGRAPELGPIAGHITRFANGWPALAMAVVQAPDAAGLAQIALHIGELKAAGGLPGLKRSLGMGMRLPVVGGVEGALTGLSF